MGGPKIRAGNFRSLISIPVDSVYSDSIGIQIIMTNTIIILLMIDFLIQRCEFDEVTENLSDSSLTSMRSW